MLLTHTGNRPQYPTPADKYRLIPAASYLLAKYYYWNFNIKSPRDLQFPFPLSQTNRLGLADHEPSTIALSWSHSSTAAVHKLTSTDNLLD